MTAGYTLAGVLRSIAAPAAILLAAALAVAASPSLPPTLAGLRVLGPVVLLSLGAAMALWFNRGRPFIALASLLAGLLGYTAALGLGSESFAARAMFTALAVLVPLNILLALVFAERGVWHHFNYRWFLFAAAEILSVAWIASAGQSSLSGTAWHEMLDHWALRSPPPPFVARAMFAAAFSLAVWRARPRPLAPGSRPLDVGMAGALVAFFIACEGSGLPGVFGAFTSASAVILLVALLQESHRLAFHDDLTGLPSRRALEERLRGLGPVFAIGMVDVDHFKEFNDTHGHVIGDQVLKLVAARLALVEGGGTAYRYGGEEFVVLFPGRSLAEVLPRLESLRGSVEAHKMAVRAPDRPKDLQTGTALRRSRSPDKTLSVTVSIGAAERNENLATPAMVITAADEALYRAKKAGRNRVSE